MKKMMMNLVLGLSILTAAAYPAKKAEAAITVASGGTAVIVGLGGLGLSGYGVLNSAFCGFAYDQQSECLGISGLMFFGGIALVYLDEDQQPKQFKTIPSYLLEEMTNRSLAKARKVKADSAGNKKVVFTHSEVDDLFMLADDYTSNEELSELRSLLTNN